MKIIFNQDTKRLPEVAQYADMVAQVLKVFTVDLTKELGHNLKFYYVDSDEDIISVTSQSDYEEALAQYPGNKLRLVLAQSVEEAQ